MAGDQHLDLAPLGLVRLALLAHGLGLQSQQHFCSSSFELQIEGAVNSEIEWGTAFNFPMEQSRCEIECVGSA